MRVARAGEPGLLENYLTKRQLASLLGKTERTLDVWHARGIAPRRVEIGKIRLYRKQDIEAWLEERLVSQEATCR